MRRALAPLFLNILQGEGEPVADCQSARPYAITTIRPFPGRMVRGPLFNNVAVHNSGARAFGGFPSVEPGKQIFD
jgi:hypothetical protein